MILRLCIPICHPSKDKVTKWLLSNDLLDALLHSEGLLHLSLWADQDAGPILAPRHEVGALLSGPACVTPLLDPDVGRGAPQTIREL